VFPAAPLSATASAGTFDHWPIGPALSRSLPADGSEPDYGRY
jgi:hypothetical protein